MSMNNKVIIGIGVGLTILLIVIIVMLTFVILRAEREEPREEKFRGELEPEREFPDAGVLPESEFPREEGRGEDERNVTPPPQPPPLQTSGLKIIAPQGGGIYLGAHNQEGDGLSEFEIALGQKVTIAPSACPDGGTEGTLPKIDISCHESLWQKGYVTTFGIEVVMNGKFTNEDIVAGKIDNELKQVAREIANWGRPILWLYQREPMVQFPVLPSTVAKGDDAKPQLYIDVHRHIHDVVENEIKVMGKQSTITWVMGGIIEYGFKGFYTSYYRMI